MVAAAFVGLSALSQPADANTLTLFGSYSSPPPGQQITYDANDDRAEVVCTFFCEGLLADLASGVYDPNVPNATHADGFSGTAADLFALANSSEATETAFVNAVTGASFATGTKTDTGGADNTTFISSALYILLKIGASPDYALIRNTAINNEFDFSAFAGEGAGLSHYTEFGVIPLPAGLPLMFGALGVFGFLARRRRKMMTA